jgi:hypothetical protein
MAARYLRWSRFLRAMEWRQGEHVTVIGPTGAGKTTLVKELLWFRDYVVVFAAKPRDPLLDEFQAEGYTIIHRWPPPEPREDFARIVLWPPVKTIQDNEAQRTVFIHALDAIYRTGDWCVYWDEARYMVDFLNLRMFAELYWLQGRSLGISFVVASQRPAWLPLSAYDQATHLFFFYDNDERNVKRLVEMAPISPKETREALASLTRHDFVYFNTRTGQSLVSRVDRREVQVG